MGLLSDGYVVYWHWRHGAGDNEPPQREDSL